MAAKTKAAVLSRKQKFAVIKAHRVKRREIADLAQRYLDRHQSTRYRINVNREAVVQRGDTWLVVAEPDKADAGYDFYNRLAEASMELEDKEKLSLFLVPVIPPEDD